MVKALLLILLWTCLGAISPAAPPNIILVLADDLGVSDLSCYGRKDFATPNLDRLAAKGVRFTSAYCAQPICSASRAALMTGKHPARLHLTNFLPGRADSAAQKLLQPVIEGQLPLEETTVAEILKRAGYATACIGKWHLGGAGFGPETQGFDTTFPGNERTSPTETEGSKGEFELTARACNFIEKNKTGPFLLYLAHHSPHIPFSARPEDIARHRDAFNPTYAAVVESLDASVGRLMQQVESLGLDRQTVFIFTSDNGGLHVLEGPETPATSNAPWRAGKGFLYEGGLRVPLLIHWPGLVPPASVHSAPVVLADLVPTLIAAAGLDPASEVGPLDAVSLLPVLRGEPPDQRRLFWHFPHYTNQGSRPGGAVRDGRWKLITHYESETHQLFDLDADPGETTDVAGAHAGIVDELSTAHARWRERIGAQECLPNLDFDPALHAPLYEHLDVSLLAPLPHADPAAKAERMAALTRWRKGMNEAVRGSSARITPAHGDIRLEAKTARVHGAMLRYEPQPAKNTLGYWTNVDDWAEWSFEVPTAGNYEVEVLQGCGSGNGGSEVEVRVGSQPLRFVVTETGHFQHFIQRPIGPVTLSAGPATLVVKPLAKANAAVMDLRRVVLRPTTSSTRRRIVLPPSSTPDR